MTKTKFKIKLKPCEWCGLDFEVKRMGQKTCENAQTNYECAREYGKAKAKKEADAKTDLLVKAMRENTKSLSEYKDELQELINKIVRLIDKGHPCISSGAKNYSVHAGHFKTVGAHENIRFNLLVIFAQADYENTYGHGNESHYREGLKNTFGPELVEEIDGLSLKYREIRIRKVDIIEAKIIASKIIRELEAENKVYTTSERIELRRKFNERINLYSK